METEHESDELLKLFAKGVLCFIINSLITGAIIV